jgi:glycosyltransferase involved in cell wall biosynthesis
MVGKYLFTRNRIGNIAGLKFPGKSAGHRRKPRKTDGRRMISVIIPAHNEENYIGLTLDAVNRQNYPNFEVIVVANGCTDRTAAIAFNACDRLIVLSNKGLGVARNLGAKLAQGEWLIFLDADTVLEPGALETVAHKFSREYSAGTFRGRPDRKRAIFHLIYLVKNFVHRWSVHQGSSGVIVCWRKDFLAAHGFDEALQVRENSDLIRRLRSFGKYRYLGEATTMTSMRRYENAGTRSTLWFWFKLWLRSRFTNLWRHQYETIR